MTLNMPWYYGWNIVAAGMAAQAVIFGIYIYSFTLWIAPWTSDFGIARSEAMMVFFTVQVANAIFAPVAGRALDRFPIRMLMLIAAASFSSSLALAAFVSEFWQLAVLYGVFMVLGMAWAGTVPAAALVARWFGRRRGVAMGISTVGTSIGGLLLPPLVAGLQEEYGWRDANLILAALSFAIISLAALVVFDTPEKAGLHHEGQATDAAASSGSSLDRQWTVNEALKSRMFWAVGATFLLLSFTITGVQQNLAPLGADAGIEQTQIAWYISIMAMVMIFAKLAIGYISDQVSYRLLLGLVTFCVALSLIALIFAGASSFALLCASILLGTGLGGMLPMLGLIVANLFGPASLGRIQGLLILIMLPAALAPLMAAWISDSTGSYQIAWIVLLAMLVPAAFCVWTIRPAESAQRPGHSRAD